MIDFRKISLCSFCENQQNQTKEFADDNIQSCHKNDAFFTFVVLRGKDRNERENPHS